MSARRIAALAAFDALAILIVLGLVSLAAWQLQRRIWKLDLIQRVEARAHAAPASAPGRGEWSRVSAQSDEYRRVAVSGRWLDARPALVQAVTEHGGGYWVLAPLQRDDGSTVFINRGFIPVELSRNADWKAAPGVSVAVTGKLRLSEPGGAFLRTNDPVTDRWFSRDIPAIAAARQLDEAAPYFIDAEGTAKPGEYPIPGLTVLAFTNNHLVYALTWAALAIMTAAAAIYVNVQSLRRGPTHEGGGRDD